AHDAGEVEVGGRVVGVGAQARPGEHRFHEHRATQQCTEGDTHDGHDRQCGSAQHVIEHDASAGETLRPGRAHVVAVEDLEHRGAHETGQQSDGDEREHHHRKGKVSGRVEEADAVTVEQIVDRVEIGRAHV